jgi:hypothetical protein
MAVETIGEAHVMGWRVIARCTHGRDEDSRSKSSRQCRYRKELDLETLVWTRGRAFPLSRLESRLRCPHCGSRDIRVLFEAPGSVAVR